jgi:hypothetical protein
MMCFCFVRKPSKNGIWWGYVYIYIHTVHSLSCRSWPHLASCNLSPLLQLVFPWHSQISNFHGLEHRFAYEITTNPPQSQKFPWWSPLTISIPYGNSHIPIYVSVIAWWYPHDPNLMWLARLYVCRLPHGASGWEASGGWRPSRLSVDGSPAMDPKG